MATYKAFWINSRTNLVRSETIEAVSDDQARALALQNDKGVRQEIWFGARFVGSIEHNGTQNRVRAAKRAT